MTTLLLFQLASIVVALIVSFAMLVWPGIHNVPNWVVIASMVLIANGGGAAINLILKA